MNSNKAERIGFEESCKLAWQSGGMRRLAVARVKYRALDGAGEASIEATPMPAELLPRSLAAPCQGPGELILPGSPELIRAGRLSR